MENDILLALNFLTLGDPTQIGIYYRQFRSPGPDKDLLDKLNVNGKFFTAS